MGIVSAGTGLQSEFTRLRWPFSSESRPLLLVADLFVGTSGCLAARGCPCGPVLGRIVDMMFVLWLLVGGRGVVLDVCVSSCRCLVVIGVCRTVPETVGSRWMGHPRVRSTLLLMRRRGRGFRRSRRTCLDTPLYCMSS